MKSISPGTWLYLDPWSAQVFHCKVAGKCRPRTTKVLSSPCSDNRVSFLCTTSLPPLPNLAVNKYSLAFLSPSPSSISNGVAIYHTAAHQITVISALLYVLHTSDFSFAGRKSEQCVLSKDSLISLIASWRSCKTCIIIHRISCWVLWANVSHWVILLSDRYLNLKKNLSQDRQFESNRSLEESSLKKLLQPKKDILKAQANLVAKL